MPLLGAHMSIAGGCHNALLAAQAHGCQAVQLFTKNANQWDARDLTDEEVASIAADFDKVHKSAAWQEILKTKGWADTYLAGDAFKAQLEKDISATEGILKEIGLVQ